MHKMCCGAIETTPNSTEEQIDSYSSSWSTLSKGAAILGTAQATDSNVNDMYIMLLLLLIFCFDFLT